MELYSLIGKVRFEHVCTVGISELAERVDNFSFLLDDIIDRFSAGDYGDVCQETNDYQVMQSDVDNRMIMGIYEIENTVVWVCMDYYSSNKRVITVLLPEEY